MSNENDDETIPTEHSVLIGYDINGNYIKNNSRTTQKKASRKSLFDINSPEEMAEKYYEIAGKVQYLITAEEFLFYACCAYGGVTKKVYDDQYNEATDLTAGNDDTCTQILIQKNYESAKWAMRNLVKMFKHHQDIPKNLYLLLERFAQAEHLFGIVYVSTIKNIILRNCETPVIISAANALEDTQCYREQLSSNVTTQINKLRREFIESFENYSSDLWEYSLSRQCTPITFKIPGFAIIEGGSYYDKMTIGHITLEPANASIDQISFQCSDTHYDIDADDHPLIIELRKHMLKENILMESRKKLVIKNYDNKIYGEKVEANKFALLEFNQYFLEKHPKLSEKSNKEILCEQRNDFLMFINKVLAKISSLVSYNQTSLGGHRESIFRIKTDTEYLILEPLDENLHISTQLIP